MENNDFDFDVEDTNFDVEERKPKKNRQRKPKNKKATYKVPLKDVLRDKFRSKTFLGITILVISALIIFVVSPLINGLVAKREDVVKVARFLPKGSLVTADDIVLGTVAQIDLPKNAATSKEQVLGTFTQGDLFPEDIVTREKLSPVRPLENPYLYDLELGKIAVSVQVDGLAEGLSGKLKAGDIVSIFSVISEATGNKEEDEIITSQSYPELRYVRVLAVTNASIKDIDVDETDFTEAEKELIPATITLEVVPYQAEILAGLNHNATIHVGLVARADQKELVDAYLKAEDEFIDALLLEQAKEEYENEATNPFANPDAPKLKDPFKPDIIFEEVESTEPSTTEGVEDENATEENQENEVQNAEEVQAEKVKQPAIEEKTPQAEGVAPVTAPTEPLV